MFSSKLALRVVANRTCTATIAASSSSSTTASRQRQHQRRHSSSKTSSCPPDSSASGGKPAPTAKGATADDTASLSETAPQQQQKSHKKVGRGKRPRTAEGPSKMVDQFAGLPAVPGTQHLDHNDLTTSAFFSLHRPLSLATTIPPPSTTEAFDSIFVSRPQRDPWENGNSAERRPEDVVYALSNLFDNLDTSASESQDDGMRWQVISESSSHDGVKHLDGPPRMKSLDDMVAHFKPFHAPPPPQPFTNEQKPAEKKRAAKQPRQKRYATTIYLTESTGLNGQTTFTASTSPIVRIPGPEEQSAFEEPAADGSRARTFRERARNARRAYFLCQQESLAAKPSVRAPVRRAPSAARKERMMLISVKRQRKLKMKKHKYKKLMKRTRNLRRRQDRA